MENLNDNHVSSSDKLFKFYCPRCEYGTDLKGNLVLHLNSKKECKVHENNKSKDNISREEILKSLQSYEHKLPQTVCCYCNKLVAKSNISRHIKTCKKKPEPLNDEKPTENTPIIFQTKEELDKHIEKKICEFLDKRSSQGSTYNMVTNTTYNNTINIVNINSFGNESVDHIKNDFLSYCLMNPKKGITELIENIHYNDDVPQNKNIRFKSNKNNTFEQYKDEQWIECDASYTLDELIRKGYRLMNLYYVNNFMNDPELAEDEVKKTAVEKFRFLNDTKSIDYFKAKRNIRLLVKNKTYYIVAPANDDNNEIISTEQQID
jgi:hypothetical protein